MGIEPQFSKQQILKKALESVQKIDNYVLNELKFIGLEFVRNARMKASDAEYSNDAKDLVVAAKLAGASGLNLGSASSFTDRTGALRSSIGFIITKNGKIVEQDFVDSDNGSDKSSGKATGLKYAKQLRGSELGYTLIVVAGMQYAVYVEAKGFDVITGSSFFAEQSLKEAIESVGKAFQR